MIVSPTYSIVIPVYNSDSCIVELVDELIKEMQVENKKFEILLIDDSSTDDSWLKINQLKKRYSDTLMAIKLSNNFGQHNATLCGFKYAKGKYVITIDDDFEYLPSDLSKLIELREEKDYQIVYGIGKESKSIIRYILSTSIRYLVRLLNGEQTAKGSSFRIIKIDLAKKILKQSNYFSMIDEFLLWYTSSVGFVDVNRQPSRKKRSNYTIFSLSRFVLGTIILSSSLPLKIIKVSGILMMMINAIWGAVVIYRKLVESITVEGYTSLLIAILFSTGFTIFSLSIIAEYIRKSILISYNKPSFYEETIL